MEAKEKAHELWMKLFQKQIEVTGSGDGNLCVEMALIAVEEIIESKPLYPIIIPVGALGDFIKQAADYWLQVKQEIEKL